MRNGCCLLILMLTCACSAPPTASPSLAPPVGDPAPPPAAPPAVASAAPEQPLPTSSASAGPVSPAPASTEIELGHWSLTLDKPCTAIAIGKKRIALLESVASINRYRAVWMGDLGKDGSWRELTIPKRLQPGEDEVDSLAIYFGRDDRPRLMGTRMKDGVAHPLYYRWKGRWRDRAGEIGRLDRPPPGALFGILGHDDPEVVCKLGDTCIIKRLTGWTMVPAPANTHGVEIAGGSAFAIRVDGALRIDEGDKAWRSFGAPLPWKSPNGFWPFADGTMWVADDTKLHHWDGKAWRTVDSPVLGARRPWGRAPDDVWLAAMGGLAHYDGKRWRKLKKPRGDIYDVRGTASQVWAVGNTGVWVGSG